MAFASYLRSHLSAAEHPEDEEEDVPLEQLPRSGGVRAFSHLPEGVANDAGSEHADTGGHADFEPPAPTGSDNDGSIGPFSSLGAKQPTGRSRFLTPRPMPPEFARQQTKTYGATPNNRSNSGYASNLGSGDRQAATNESLSKITGAEMKAAASGSAGVSSGGAKVGGFTVVDPELHQANQEFEARLAEQREIEKQADDAKLPLQKHLESINKDEKLRQALQAAELAQKVAKKGMPKIARQPFDYLNEKSGLAPKVQIQKLDAELSKKNAQKAEYEKQAVQFDDALRKARKATEEAGQKKRELEDKQKQPPAKPAPPPQQSPIELVRPV